MKEKLNLNSVITIGKYNGKTINEIIEEDRKEIISLSKKGFYFDDEVFKKARFTHTIKDVKFIYEFVDKVKQKNTKTYKKDTKNVKDIIECLSTIDTSYDDEEIDTLNNDFE